MARGTHRSRPTIKDVALRAGVSTTAVSYVLNDRPGVGDATRERVSRAVADLGYHRDGVAHSLRIGRSPVLGLVLATIRNPFYTELAASVIDAAAKHQYGVFIGQVYEGTHTLEEQTRTLIDHRCDGLIFASVSNDDESVLDSLTREGVPFVQAIRRVDGLAGDFVGIDDRAAAREAMEHIIDRGVRNIALLMGPAGSSANRARLQGYQEALASASIRIPRSRIVNCQFSTESGYMATRQILARKWRCDAIVCADDMIALGAMDAAQEAGYDLAADVAVIGFDDLYLASLRPIQLSTVRYPIREVGEVAVTLLVERLEGSRQAPRDVILQHKLVERRSSLWTGVGERNPRSRADRGKPRS